MGRKMKTKIIRYNSVQHRMPPYKVRMTQHPYTKITYAYYSKMMEQSREHDPELLNLECLCAQMQWISYVYSIKVVWLNPIQNHPQYHHVWVVKTIPKLHRGLLLDNIHFLAFTVHGRFFYFHVLRFHVCFPSSLFSFHSRFSLSCHFPFSSSMFHFPPACESRLAFIFLLFPVNFPFLSLDFHILRAC